MVTVYICIYINIYPFDFITLELALHTEKATPCGTSFQAVPWTSVSSEGHPHIWYYPATPWKCKRKLAVSLSIPFQFLTCPCTRMIHDYIFNEVFTCGMVMWYGTFLYMGLHQTYNITISIQLYMSGARIQQDHEMLKCQHSQYQDQHMIHNYM